MTASEWRARLDKVSRRFPGTSYCHNVVTGPDGAAAEWDAIDEITLPSGGVAAEIGTALSESASGLFRTAATAAMVTHAKVFV